MSSSQAKGNNTPVFKPDMVKYLGEVGAENAWDSFEAVLDRYGKRVHPLFNIEHVKNSYDILIGEERLLFFSKPEDDESLYEIFQERGIAQFLKPETSLEDVGIGVRQIPHGTISYQQLVHNTNSAGENALTRDALFRMLGLHIGSLHKATGRLPEPFRLQSASYVRAGNGYACLTPPVRLGANQTIENIAESLYGQLCDAEHPSYAEPHIGEFVSAYVEGSDRYE